MKEAAVLPQDQIQLLFSNLEEMLVYHSGFNNCMKAKRRETPVVGDIGDLLLDMVSIFICSGKYENPCQKRRMVYVFYANASV